MLYQAPRGTADLLPEEQKFRRYIESKAVALARSYGYGRIDSPVFEDAGLFVRSVGEGTDIVEKEMYTFEDRGGDQITLRPEGNRSRVPRLPGTRNAQPAPSRCGCTTFAPFSATKGPRREGSASTTSLASRSWETPTRPWTPKLSNWPGALCTPSV